MGLGDEKRKRMKQIASLRGQAGKLSHDAEVLQVHSRLPYTAFRNLGTCNVCGEALVSGSLYSVIPHTPMTCPGPAAKVRV
jgi:hypothetical protein